jgi:acyl-CoA thioester hydrolase
MKPTMKREHEIEIRVRYQETDAQGRVHHANYFTYFEMGRVEQLRASGVNYGDLEEQGIMLVIHKIQCQYIQPASYDDVLTLRTITERITPARIDHCYEVWREGELLAKGNSTLACVDRTGKVRRIPEWMMTRE